MSRDRSSVTACWPEHMWRIGLAFSPSRARRAAVSASSGMPSLPQARKRLADPGAAEHGLDRPDVEVLAAVRAGHDRELGGLEVERLDAAGLDQGHDAERLDGRAQRHDPVGVAELADEPAVDVRFDDVAAVDALLDPVAQLAHEDRRLGTGATLRARPAGPGRRALGRGGHSREDTAEGSRGSLVQRSAGGFASRQPWTGS